MHNAASCHPATVDRERLRRLLARPELTRLVDAVRDRLERGDADWMAGRVSVANPSEAEAGRPEVDDCHVA